MKISNPFAFFICISFLIVSCQKKDKVDIENIFVQAHPKNITVDPKPVEFKWDSNVWEVLFELFDKNGDLILDSLTSENSLTFPNLLKPESNYSWRISSGELSNESNFTTT